MRSLATRTFLLVAGAVLLSGAVTVLVAAVVTRHRLDAQVQRNVERQVRAIAATLQAPRTTGPHLFFLSSHGLQPLPSRGPVADGLEPVRDATRTALAQTPPGSTVRTSAGRLRVAVLTTPQGPIALSRPASLRPRDWRPVLGSVLLSALVGVLLAGLVATLLARRLLGPLRALSRASRSIAAGDLSARVPVDGSDELADLATRFNTMADEVATARQRERELVLAVSHDFRTPLTSVKGYAEALEEHAVAPDVAAHAIGIEARRLERLVTDLLDLGRSERRTLAFELRPVDLGAVAEELRERFAPTTASCGVELDVVLHRPITVEADPDRLAQVAANLIENALRVTPGGGRVTVTAEGDCLEVRDTGPGIAAEDHARAFERYYLHNRYQGRDGIGVGLGLAIARELTEAMGGTIRLESDPGGGTSFLVRLPPAPTPAAGRFGEQPAEMAPRRSGT